MTATPERLYKAHVLNLREVNTAFERISRELNASLARNDQKTADALLKTAMLLLGAWAENRLKKLQFEKNGFSVDQRRIISSNNSQIEAWKSALEIGFRKRYDVSSADLSTSLRFTPRSYYTMLVSTINNELRPIIETRNKLAHGQWARALNNENNDFSPETITLINSENALTIKSKKRIIEYMANIIHDLIAGNHAFERDIDNHYKNLESAKREIKTKSYNKWLSHMKLKKIRGKSREPQ